MAQYWLLIFVILFGSLQTVYCVLGNDSFNSFGPKLAKKTESKQTELSTDKGFFFENHDAPLDKKIIEKRRLFLNKDIISPETTTKESAEYFARKTTNYSEPENENHASQYQQRYDNWQNARNRFYLPTESGNSQNFPEIRLSLPNSGQTTTAEQMQQANQNYNWEQKNNFFEKSRLHWNKEEIFRQNANPEYDPRVGDSYNNRPLGAFNNHFANDDTENRSSDIFNNRFSITTFNDAKVQNAKNFNDERVDKMNSAFTSYPNMNYYNKYPKNFWNPDFYRPEKGVVINLNTECPMPKQFNSQLVHKFFFSPKAPINTPEVSTFQIPETALISAQKMTPMYYL